MSDPKEDVLKNKNSVPDSDSEPENYRPFSDNVDTDVSNNGQDESDAPSPPMARSNRFVHNHIPNNIHALNHVNSDSDSCTDAELFAGGQTTDETTSTSESEETQIWVPVANRPSYRQNAASPSIPLPPSLTSSSASEALQQHLNKHRNTLPRCAHRDRPDVEMSSANVSNIGSPEMTENEETVDRCRRHSWHSPHAMNNKNRYLLKSKSLHHDPRTGGHETILIDTQGPNGDSGIGHEEAIHSGDSFDRDFPVSASMSMLRKRGHDSEELQSYETMIDTLFVVMSGLYAMCLVIFSFVVAIGQLFVPTSFEGFYIYMYGLSICFLIYMYVYLLRNTNIIVGKKRRRFVPPEDPVSSPKITYRHTDTSGSFYLRLGAVGFGIGSMIKSGLHFAEMFDHDLIECNGILLAIRPILHVTFTFSQLYFVFLYSKICIHSNKVLARFGIMHMIATNISVWIRNVVTETTREIQKINEEQNTSIHETKFATENMTDLCNGPSLMREVVYSSGPYLYPCSVLYSIICAGMMYLLWCNVGKQCEFCDNSVGQSIKVKSQRINVDCTSSSRGLFLGIIILVASIISMITFFVLVKSASNVQSAIKIEHLSKVAIHVLTSVAVILAFHRMYNLRFIYDNYIDIEAALLLISLTGVYMYGLLCISAAGLTNDQSIGILVVTSCVLCIFQATIQTVFLLHILRKSALNRDQERIKPGREFVTFLLMCNIALWAINTFEMQLSKANPIQLQFYGAITWTTLSHVSLPLQILFRFQSSVCLINIWRKAWKRKKM